MQPRRLVALVTVLLATAAAIGQELVVGTLAGRPVPGYLDANGRLAQFRAPTGMAQVGGILFVADAGNHAIRQIDLATGEVSTLTGTGTAGHQDGSLAQATFDTPRDVLYDPTRNELLVADSGNHVIRAVLLGEGRVLTLAGTGTAGWADGPADQAQFAEPSGLCIVPVAPIAAVGDRPSQTTEFLLVADTGNHCLRAVREETPPGARDSEAVPGFYVTTVAGQPGSPGFEDGTTLAQYNRPTGLALESPDRVLVADSGNHAVRLYDTLFTITIAGDGTPGSEDTPLPPATQAARFNSPRGIIAGLAISLPPQAADQLPPPPGHMVLDTGNSRIRQIDPVTHTVTTFAGSVAGCRDAPLGEALCDRPWAGVWEATGEVAFFSDRGNHCIRSLGVNTPPAADAGSGYAVGPGDGLLLDGTGSSDPDYLLGDSVAQYAWDLNGDGMFGDVLGATVYLDAVRVWRLFGTPAPAPVSEQEYTKIIGLEVTDLFGATDAARTSVAVTGDLAEPMTIQLLPEPEWTAGTENEVQWTGSPFATAYELQWSRMQGFAAIQGSITTRRLKAAATGLRHNVRYYFRARAILSGAPAGEGRRVAAGTPGPWSNVESSTQDAVAPRSVIASPSSPFITARPRVPLVVESTESGSGFSHEVLLYSHNGGPITRYPGRYVPSVAMANRGSQDTPVALGILNIVFDIGRAAGEGVYQLFAVGVDNVGNRERIGRVPDLVLVVDASPPVITKIRAFNIRPRSADVLWRTNEPTTGTIEYGQTTGYASKINDPTLRFTHTVHLTGLDPDTIYHLRILARDRAQNLAVSADHVFETRERVPPAAVLRREPLYTAGTANALSWVVAAPAARYRLEWDTQPTFPTPASLVTRHTEATAAGLTDGAGYFYRVMAINGDGVRGPWSNVEHSTQDATPPDSRVSRAVVPVEFGPVIHLIPSSSDATSGVRYLLLYFAKDAGAFRRVGPRIPPTARDVMFDATPYGGGRYAFYTRAVDRVGNREAPPSVPDVEVDLRLATNLEYVGDLGTTTGQSALLAASLTDMDGHGVEGAAISYTLGPLTGVLPPTDGAGLTEKSVAVGLAAGTYRLVLNYTGDAAHLPSQVTVDMRVKPVLHPPPAQRIAVQAEGSVADGADGRYEFGVEVTSDPLEGAVVIRDVRRGRVFRATALTSVTLSGHTAAITGLCSVNGAGSFRFVVWVADAVPDTFGMTTTDGTLVPQTALAAGTVTIAAAP